MSGAETSRIALEQADRLFHSQVTKDRLAAADSGVWQASLWEAVEEAGLPLALVAEARGGVGLPAADAMRLVRRSAWHALPLPLAETMLAQFLWSEAGGEPFSGPASLAPTNARDTIGLRRNRDAWVLEGAVRRVPWASDVAHVLVLARDPAGAAHIALLPGGSQNFAMRNLAFEPRGRLDFSGTALRTDAVRMAPGTCDGGMLPFGAMLRAQQMVGAMERSLGYALSYANERKQFGRPIGKFQAVQHMLAEAAGHYAAASAAADLASEAFGTPGFGFAAAVAKARAGEAAGKVAEIVHQVHGAMGFTQEHPLHFSTRRLWSWRDEFGNETYWQEQIGRMVCAQGGEALWPMLVGA